MGKDSGGYSNSKADVQGSRLRDLQDKLEHANDLIFELGENLKAAQDQNHYFQLASDYRDKYYELEKQNQALQDKLREQQIQISNDAIDRINDDRDITIGVLELVNTQLKKENQQLKQIIRETLPLARRYAHNRSTFAPTAVNEAIDKALELGVELFNGDDPQYADDGDFGKWNPKTKKFEKE